jgi:hypothetical protein
MRTRWAVCVVALVATAACSAHTVRPDAPAPAAPDAPAQVVPADPGAFFPKEAGAHTAPCPPDAVDPPYSFAGAVCYYSDATGAFLGSARAVS